MRPFTLNRKTWERATVSKRLDERSYQVTKECATYRRNRVDLSDATLTSLKFVLFLLFVTSDLFDPALLSQRREDVT